MALPQPLKKEYKTIFDAIDDDIKLMKSFLIHVEQNEKKLVRKPSLHPQHIFHSERLLWLLDIRKELQRFENFPDYKLNLDTILDCNLLGYPDIDIFLN